MSTDNENPFGPVTFSGKPGETRTVDLNVSGIGGERFLLRLTNVNKEKPSEKVNAYGTPGLYTVGFVLQQPSAKASRDSLFFTFDNMPGDSHWVIAQREGVTEAEVLHFLVQVEGERLHFVGFPNEENRLAKILSQPFEASNQAQADTKASTVIQGLLSHYSAFMDIPLQIAMTETTELANGTKTLVLTAPFFQIGTDWSYRAQPDPEFANFVGIYREALNSNSPAYRFLCLYKILEGIRKRRVRLGRKSRQRIKIVRTNEVVPVAADEQLKWLQDLFPPRKQWDQRAIQQQIFLPEVVGRKLNAVVENNLRPLRDHIAHSILDTGVFLSPDNLAATNEIGRWLPFLRCAVRRTLRNDFPEHFLAHLNE